MSTEHSTAYLERISELLRPIRGDGPVALDLFAGCGGLALGFEAQGFQTHGFEMDADCCETYRSNLGASCSQIFLTQNTILPSAQVVIGGPPCQPFSVSGNQHGLRDSRDGFPSFIAAVERIRPELWLFENVRGLFYRNKWYLEETLARLADLGYAVDYRLLNAVDFDVPQRRERVVVVGHHGGFEFPIPTQRRIAAGEALGGLASIAPPESKFLTPSMDAYVARYERASACVRPRDLDLKKPARTLTCRNLAGATGDMHRLLLPDGRRRRLLQREAARLQSFPSWFEFSGAETSCFNQIGNAVPPMFAWHLAGAVKAYLAGSRSTVLTTARYRQPVLLGA
ncbi:MAG: DNA cytosine methyltransferase [Chloroflexota bacterium]